MNDLLPIAIGFITLSAGLFLFFLGFGDWNDKRLLESTPVSKCRSVALGPVTLSGKVGGPNPIPSLIAQLPSFISRVVVEEYRSNGKSRSWRVVHKRELRMPFYVEDPSGEIKVVPDKAVLWLERDVKYSTEDGIVEYAPAAGERASMQTQTLDEMFSEYCLTRGISRLYPLRFTETNLSPGDPIFVYGTACSGKDTGDSDSIVVRKTFWQTPYIMEGGKVDMQSKLGLRRSLKIAAGAAAVIFATGLLARASTGATVAGGGEYVSSDISLLADIVAAFALLGLGIFMYVALIYNGLVNIRNEVDRAFSNVDVLLQQRFDLIPNLVSVCRTYMEHESEVMQAVATSRGLWTTARDRQGKLIAAAESHGLMRQLLATAEVYPSLRANENFLQLQNALTLLEEQIADRRELYNSAVSLFNSRIQVFPDRLVAGVFHFAVQPFFAAADAPEKVPVVNATSGS